jgi:outer membrane receptor protein involved in Fe transport
MKGWLDLGLGAEYRITDRFSAFLKLNNLLNQGYERWYNYPVQGLNVLAGVGFSF